MVAAKNACAADENPEMRRADKGLTRSLRPLSFHDAQAAAYNSSNWVTCSSGWERAATKPVEGALARLRRRWQPQTSAVKRDVLVATSAIAGLELDPWNTSEADAIKRRDALNVR